MRGESSKEKSCLKRSNGGKKKRHREDLGVDEYRFLHLLHPRASFLNVPREVLPRSSSSQFVKNSSSCSNSNDQAKNDSKSKRTLEVQSPSVEYSILEKKSRIDSMSRLLHTSLLRLDCAAVNAPKKTNSRLDYSIPLRSVLGNHPFLLLLQSHSESRVISYDPCRTNVGSREAREEEDSVRIAKKS